MCTMDCLFGQPILLSDFSFSSADLLLYINKLHSYYSFGEVIHPEDQKVISAMIARQSSSIRKASQIFMGGSPRDPELKCVWVRWEDNSMDYFYLHRLGQDIFPKCNILVDAERRCPPRQVLCDIDVDDSVIQYDLSLPKRFKHTAQGTSAKRELQSALDKIWDYFNDFAQVASMELSWGRTAQFIRYKTHLPPPQIQRIVLVPRKLFDFNVTLTKFASLEGVERQKALKRMAMLQMFTRDPCTKPQAVIQQFQKHLWYDPSHAWSRLPLQNSPDFSARPRLIIVVDINGVIVNILRQSIPLLGSTNPAIVSESLKRCMYIRRQAKDLIQCFRDLKSAWHGGIIIGWWTSRSSEFLSFIEAGLQQYCLPDFEWSEWDFVLDSKSCAANRFRTSDAPFSFKDTQFLRSILVKRGAQVQQSTPLLFLDNTPKKILLDQQSTLIPVPEFEEGREREDTQTRFSDMINHIKQTATNLLIECSPIDHQNANRGTGTPTTSHSNSNSNSSTVPNTNTNSSDSNSKPKTTTMTISTTHSTPSHTTNTSSTM
ncbi:hypothetical protein Pelo_11525 [Pelomyxa schiedti]|nr:hypothetical protein Pelo_11525 [Pelomyxa schiedti]